MDKFTVYCLKFRPSYIYHVHLDFAWSFKDFNCLN